MKRLLTFLLLAIVACSKTEPPLTPPQGPVCEEKPRINTNITLIGGEAADQKEWPASVYVYMSGAACSATIVGEKSLMVATHCVEGNGVKLNFKLNGSTFNGVCTNAPGYSGNPTADWSLCLIDKAVTGIKYESLNTDTSLLKVGDQLRLTGFGCIKPGGGGGNDGVFRVGTAPIISLPSGTNYDITTKGKSALCYGDSGGAAYKEYAPGKRVIVGVNSRGDISTTSYLPSVASKVFQDFAVKWASDKGQLICGIHKDAKDCRAATECTPQPYVNLKPELYIKKGESVYIGMPSVPGQSFKWNNSYALDSDTSSNPKATPCVSEDFTVTATTVCGSVSKTVKVIVK